MSDVALRAAGLTKRYGSARALDGLDLEVGVGEVHAFLGPNGAGKTTAIRILLGLLHKDGGEVSLLGADPWRDAVELHRRLAYVPGDVTLWPSLTGGEIIDLLGRLRGGISASRRKALTERFDLDTSKRARAYSRGNRQKVALIAALASEAELLLLDEPTAGLDPLMEATFRDCVIEEQHDGRTILLSSHILSEAEALSDRVTIIRQALLAITARDLKVLYPTAASRLAVATKASANPALRFLLGRLNGTSVGAFLAARWGVWGAAFAVLLTIFIVVRHTRTDEEAGRLELVGSAAVGRQAPLTAALLAAAAANVAIALLTFLWLARLGLPVAGSAALALSISGCGLVFGGVAAIAAQLVVTARGARGIAIAALGTAFVLRAVGDSGSTSLSRLSWVSPLGWVELTRSFGAGGERWWVLTLPLVASAVLVAAAFLLAAWRDHSAGPLPDRPGRATASGLLHGPFGLAWRLQRPVLAAWLAAFVFAFAAFGAGANGFGSIIGGSAVLRRYLLRVGYQATVTDAYLSALMLIAGLAAAVYSTSAVLRLRTEETGNLAELVLGAATGRTRWALSHISVAVAGACLLLAAAGLSTGLSYGILTGSVSTQLPQLLGAAAARLPATMVVAAVAVMLFGLLPWESTALAWTAVALVGVIGVFGPPLQWSTWMMDISPFTQIPKLPGGTVSAEPLLWLCAVALTIGTVGLAGLRRRDLGDLGPARPVGAIRDRLVAYASFEPSQQATEHDTAQPPR